MPTVPNRRTTLKGASASFAASLVPGFAHATGGQTIRAVMHSDLKILDPIWTITYIVRDHGYMVWDTLFAMDAKQQIQPQMVDHHEVSPDGLTWTFTLRDGLKWHDGPPVTSEDCIASLRRWAARDSMGQQLLATVATLDPVDPKTFRMVLKEPYGVLEALGKPSSGVPFIMPKRLAETDPSTQLQEVVGSGPFIFKKDEWRPGERVVYVKNPEYKPRSEPASWLAGGKVVNVDRVEWVWIPDSQTAVNALLAGEVDYLESVSHDLLPLLKADSKVKLFNGNPLGLQYDFRWNSLQPPF